MFYEIKRALFNKWTLLVVVVSLLLLGGAWGVKYYNETTQTSQATELANQAADLTEAGDFNELIDLYSTRGLDSDTFNKYTVIAWALGFSESNTVIDNDSGSVNYANTSFMNTAKDKASIRVVYSTNKDTEIFFDCSYENDKWVIKNHGWHS